jgi:hypothetical protein
MKPFTTNHNGSRRKEQGWHILTGLLRKGDGEEREGTVIYQVHEIFTKARPLIGIFCMNMQKIHK